MDSPPQTVTVRGGDFLCGKSGRKPCRVWSCEEKAIGFGKNGWFGNNSVMMIQIVRGLLLCYNREAEELEFYG